MHSIREIMVWGHEGEADPNGQKAEIETENAK